VAERPRVEVRDDPVSHAGELLADAIAGVDAARGRARVAIPGGSALAAFGVARARVGGAWSRLCLTWVDERCVDVADPGSNRGAARRAGWLEPAPAAVLPLWLDGETPRDAVERVRAGLAGPFAGELDVVLLGMGADGHVASLFPGREIDGAAGRGGVAWIGDSPKPPGSRITLTRTMLATARTTVLVATGPEKRAALERVARGDAASPAVGLPGLVIVTDQQGLAPVEEQRR